MTDTPAHTPLPWSITRAPSGRPYSIHSLSPEDLNSQPGRVGAQILRWGSFMLPSSAEAEANAAFIVRACNNHYQLIGALRDIRTSIECAAGCIEGVTPDDAYSEILSFGGTSLASAYDRAHAALSQAGGE